MAESIRTLFSRELIDLVNPYLEEGHVGDVFYSLMALATRLNIESANLLITKATDEEPKCTKKSRRPIKQSELDPILEEGGSCG